MSPSLPSRRAALAVVVAAALLAPVVDVGPSHAAAAPTGSAAPASAPATAPAPSAEAVGDPLLEVTRVEHSEDGTSTRVVTRSQGDVYGSVVENRSMRHSTLQPTGRVAQAGDEIEVALPADGSGVGLAIGAFGSYATLNGGRNVGVASLPLTAGTTTTVVAPHDGMVYLEDPRDGEHVTTVTVTGGSPSPVFVLGQTSNDDFRAQMARWPDAPLTTLVGHRVLAEFQTLIMRDHHETLDLEARTSYFDRVVELSNEGHGLVDGAAGLAGKLRHRVHFTNPDTGGGWASAGALRLTFQNASGAGRHILTGDMSDQWGLWHEIGHSYQTPTYNWRGMTETAVNVGPLYIQDALGYPIRLDGRGYQELYDRFFGQPIADRDIDAGGDMRLLMIDQLRRAFGPSALARVNQDIRMRLAAGEPLHATDDSRKQAFATSAARALDRDLRPFFEQFGLPLDADSQAVMAELPALQHPIWENRLSTQPVVEEILPPYSVPTATVAADRPRLALGQDTLDDLDAIISDVRDADGAGTAQVVDVRVDAAAPGPAAGAVEVVLENSRGVRDVVTVPADVAAGTSFRFSGSDHRAIGSVALDPATKRLAARSTGVVARPATGADRYLGVVVQGADGSVVATAAVRGTDTGSPLVDALDGLPYAEGTRIVVTQLEAHTTARFADGAEQPAPTTLTHAWRVVGDDLVGEDAVLQAPAQAPVDLQPGAGSAVETGVVTVRGVGRLQGTVVFDAPDGSTFARDQTQLTGQIRHPGGSWFGSRTVDLREGVVSEDGRTATYRLDTTVAGFATRDGSLIRWSPRVVTPVDATSDGALGLRVVGTSDQGVLDVQGQTPTRVPASLRVALTASSNVARTATVSGRALPGAVLRSGSHAADVAADGSVELVVPELPLGTTVIPVELVRDGVVVADDQFSVTLRDGLAHAEEVAVTKLVAGLDVEVPVTVGLGRTHATFRGAVELTAPEGTTFAPVDGTLTNQIRQSPVHGWQGSGSAALRDIRLSDDDRTLTATFRSSGGSFLLPVGAGNRWLPAVRVPEGHSGVGELRYRVEGDGTHGDWVVEGAAPTSSATRPDHVVPSPVDAAELAPGGTSRVRTTFRFEEAVTALRGQMTFRAPEGTRFTAGQVELAGAYRHPGMSDFRTTDSLTLGSARLSDDGRTLVATLAPTGGSFAMHVGSAVRWQPELAVDEGHPVSRTTVEASFRGLTDVTGFAADLRQVLRVGDAPESDLVASAADRVSMAPGASTAVPLGVEATIGIADLRGSLALTAPTGTTFTPGQDRLVTEVRLPGGQWQALDALVVDEGTTSADGTRADFTVRALAPLELPRGAELRWSPALTVSPGSDSGSSGLEWRLQGHTDQAAVTAGS